MNFLFNRVFLLISSLCYLVVFRIFQMFFSSLKIKIWYRHGLYFRNIIPGVSDIDTSFLFIQKTPIGTQVKAIQRFALLKQFIPLFSEVNIYEENELNFVKDCINPLELKRDPLLCRYAGFSDHPPSKEEKLVYVIKMLLYNRDNLLFHPLLSQRKWLFHLNLLEMDAVIGFPLLPSLLKILEENLFCLFPRLYLKEALEEYFRSGFISDKLHALLIQPFEILPYEIDDDFFYKPSFCQETFFKLNQSEKSVYAAHLKWDIWGVYTQYRFLVPSAIQPHLKYMEASVDLIGEEWFYLREKIRNLICLVTTWQSHVNAFSFLGIQSIKSQKSITSPSLCSSKETF